MQKFRKATHTDLTAILTILEAAIRRLGAAGVDQWQHGYPNRERIEADIEEGVGYVIEQEGEVVAYGAVIFTGEPSYREIEGAWLTHEEDYVVVHRMCVADKVVGCGFGRSFMQQVEALARGRVRSFRVDTHADNRVMQSLLPKLGFQRCGIIYFESRYLVAFEKLIA
ncbi:MAG: GNAT family N-acetyltransferase [Rikenellaceae bacterium]|nr:GNAT family N-acetyltransferase [Rikenellaceae bacterium]